MEKKEYIYDTYCGLNCGACHTLIANEQQDEKWLKTMAEQRNVKVEDLYCHGCKTDVTAFFCTNCRMRACAREKGLEFCVDCADYPCEMITNFRNDDRAHHSAVFHNLKLIKEVGVKKWLAEEAGRWACKECGTRFGWYSETCTNCGAVVYNAVAEEKDLKI
jgi:hypothetical protein